MIKSKKQSRQRRCRRNRAQAARLGKTRLSVIKSNQHISAQVFSVDGTRVLVAASSQEKTVKKDLKNGSNITAAEKVGKMLGERIKEAGLNDIAFDRSGYKYHGRVKALADAVRASGVEF